MKRFGVHSFIVGCAAAALLTAGACNRDNASTSTATPNAADTSARAAAEPNAAATSGIEAQAVNATGCLQKKGGDYILTELNEPSTGGASTKGVETKVEREQLHAAQHAYRLNANKDEDLAKLVGKQVRINGTMQKGSDLASDKAAATSGSKDHLDIAAGDLAKVDVTSIEQVAASCGSAARAPRHAKGKR